MISLKIDLIASHRIYAYVKSWPYHINSVSINLDVIVIYTVIILNDFLSALTMIVPILYGCLFLALVYLYTNLFKSVKRKLPPNAKEAPMEHGLPLVGVLHKIKPSMHHYLMEIGKKHGNIFRINLGLRELFVLNDFQALKMSLKDDSENFSGRWNGNFVRMTSKGCGILLTDGDVWAKQRSFMLKVLRDFGLGKSRTDEIVQNECTQLLETLRSQAKERIDFSEIITIHTVNIISEFLLKKRYEKDDDDINFLIRFMRRILSSPNILQILHLMIPQWDNSEVLSRIGFKLFFRSKNFDKIVSLFTKEIETHRKCLDKTSEDEDFLDKFLIKQSRMKDKDGSVGSFSDYQLIRTTFEMMAAGFDATSTAITWSLLFLAKHPDIQDRMHREIVDLMGMIRMPSTSERRLLPFTEAVIDEVLRLSSGSPLAVFHRTFHDTVINGFFIPRNSFILPNLYACHRDPSVWEKPFEFYPDHFLGSAEDGKPKYRPREELVPFSLGKRQCLGESLARAEIFIFVTSIIQRFKVCFANHVSEEEYQEALKGDAATVRYPKIKEFIFEHYDAMDI